MVALQNSKSIDHLTKKKVFVNFSGTFCGFLLLLVWCCEAREEQILFSQLVVYVMEIKTKPTCVYFWWYLVCQRSRHWRQFTIERQPSITTDQFDQLRVLSTPSDSNEDAQTFRCSVIVDIEWSQSWLITILIDLFDCNLYFFLIGWGMGKS